jgi:hypothetical protein
MMDKYGLLPHPRGNQIKSTTEFYYLCKYFDILDTFDICRYNKTVDSLMVSKGLLVRYPESPVKDDVEQHDNYVSTSSSFGICSVFKKFSRWFMFYGLKHFFRYDHRESTNGFIDWFKCFRQPYQIGIFTLNSGFIFTSCRILIGILSGYLLSLILPTWISILIGIIVGGGSDIIHLWGALVVEGYKPHGNTSGKLLMWQFCQSNYFYKFLVWIPILFFNYRLRKLYGEYPMQELCKIYYHENSGMSLLANFAEEVK